MPRVLRVVSIVAVVLALLGCPPAKVSVPNVLGMTEVSATAAIIAAQLVVGDVTAAYSENVAIGSVVSQNPAGGQKASPGSTVALILSLGPAPLVGWSYVPGENSVLGLTINNTADGGCIVSGGHDSTYDMYVLKLTASGLADWDMIYSYISSEGGHPELWGHEASGAAETADGGYIVLGAGRVDGDGLPDESYLLVKSDEAGNVAWSKSYAPDNPYSPGHYCVNNAPAALQITGDGGFVAFGSSYVGGYDLASVLKTDAAGNVDFCKVINDNAKAYNQIVTGGQQTVDGGYVLCGYSDNGYPHGYAALLIKLDEEGNTEISKTYQDAAEGHGAEAYAITQTADGGYVIGGSLINNISKVINYGCWLAKVDALGGIEWLNSYGNNDPIGYPNTIKETPQGDILAAGADHVGDMTLAKFNSGGQVLWTFTLPNDFPRVTAKDMALTADGGCILVGSGISGTTVVAKINHVFAVE